MTIEERPTWLVCAEHGALAEARTRALLLERFWVLERSVDIEGADFIIQRRLTSRSLFDRTPMRLGVVQTKYFGERTTHYVHREYVCDDDGNPRPEFFLIAHAGAEDLASVHFLSAAQIAEEFAVTTPDHNRPGRYALPASLVTSGQHQVHDLGVMLADIEHAMASLDFNRNHSFLSWVLPSMRTSDRAPLSPDYTLPIENWYGDIPKEFERIQNAARSSIYEIEDVMNMLGEIEGSADPVRVLDLAEGLWHEHRGSVNLSDELYDPDLHQVILERKKRTDALHAGNCVGPFVAAHREVKRVVEASLVGDTGASPAWPWRVTFTYDPHTFLDARCQVEFPPSLPPSEDGVHRMGERTLRGTPGRIEIEIDMRALLDWHRNSRRGIATDSPVPLDQAVRRTGEDVALRLTGAALDLLVGDPVS
jgi:hypothetical protein